MTTDKAASKHTWISKSQRPIIIAGPCSAETEEQVLETGRRIHQLGKVDIYRAGIWKPRTRPGSFEGVGAVGLPWLQKVKKETGMALTVDCLLYTSPSPRDATLSRMPSSA